MSYNRRVLSLSTDELLKDLGDFKGLTAKDENAKQKG